MSYSFTKNNNTIVKLILIDILDENVDIVRKSSINYFEETINQAFGRYFIVSFTLKLSENRKTKI